MAQLLDDLSAFEDPQQQAAQEALAPHLPKDAALLWASQPMQGIQWQPGALVRLVVGVSFIIAGSFAGLVLSFGSGILQGILFGSVFVGTGFFLAFGWFFWDRYRRQHIFYGLTTKGLYVLSGTQLTIYPIRDLAQARLYQSRSNGSAILGYPRGSKQVFCTRRIANAAAVLNLIQTLVPD